jgi:hypothetical protein
VLFAVAVVIFIVGFGMRGTSFFKHGFRQTVSGSSLEKRFDSLEAKFDEGFSRLGNRMTALEERMTAFDNRLTVIETNHFAHLKGFLTELTGILLDKSIINNAEKARLDNQLVNM